MRIMEKRPGIGDLADELLDEILSFVLQSGGLLNEPFRDGPYFTGGTDDQPTTSRYGEKTDLDRFRLVCRRFMRIGMPRKFSRFVLRFSREGFERLEHLLGMQIAGHVRYFTYMVRPFYQGSGNHPGSPPPFLHGEERMLTRIGGWPQVLADMSSDDPSSSQLHCKRLRDQDSLIHAARDLSFLRLAIAAFASLQQVKLLRLQDEADERLLDYIRDSSLETTVSLSWEPACSRAITNLGIALLESKCSSVRFIGPQISPEATLRLRRVPPATLSAVGARLASVDINFHCITDMTASFTAQSSIFRNFFSAAKNLMTIHLSFPTKLPLDSKLEHFFHRIEWKNLRTFAIQGWRLRSDEIIDFSRRHKRQLRELCLRNVYLRDGSRWRDILAVLHDEMERLEHLDLRGIDYSVHFDTITVMVNGVEGPENENHNQNQNLPPPFSVDHHHHHHPVLLSYDCCSPSRSLNSHHPLPLSEGVLRELRALAVDDLGDDGVAVGREQRSLWEAWVRASPRVVSTGRQF